MIEPEEVKPGVLIEDCGCYYFIIAINNGEVSTYSFESDFSDINLANYNIDDFRLDTILLNLGEYHNIHSMGALITELEKYPELFI